MSGPSRLSAVLSVAFLACSTFVPYPGVFARERVVHELTETLVDVDVVGGVDGTVAAPQKALQDTVWIALWTFDLAASCDTSGWEKVDNRILNDGIHYWDLDNTFGGNGNIVGTAAALGYENDLCCEDTDGYASDWYQGLRIEYDDTAPASITFDYLVDSEGGFDFLQIEEDSACASFDRVDLHTNPSASAASFRNVLFSTSGFQVGNLPFLNLTQFASGTSCVYIAFFADGGFDPCDGLQPTTVGKAIVVDNIVLDENGTITAEDFEDGSADIGMFVNIQGSTPFGPTDPGRDGSWARAYRHVTDNDTCIENTTCALLWTDDTTPTIANDPSMSFGPGGYVVRNWLDDIIVSPWVSLASTPTATGTIIQFRRFPGNFFGTSEIVQQWGIRGKFDVDDGMGGTVECVGTWGHATSWNSLSFFGWITPTASGNPPASGYDTSSNFDPSSKAIQIRHRTSDWQWVVGNPPPATFSPGPGPYVDRTRIGRIVLSGPVINEGIDARNQAQDVFPTEIHPSVTPGTGEHFRPTTDRFGTAAFSKGTDLGINNSSPYIVTGDSIHINVQDVRGTGGVARIDFYGAIVSGPHAGMAPPPHTVGANGFFVVTADSVLSSSGTIVRNLFFVDLDDYYFVGGDVLNYFWLTEDVLGGFASNPFGLSGVPTSVVDAQAATNGMLEFSTLPTINWDPDYIAAVNLSNKVDPYSDPAFLDHSTQANCILYVNRINSRRRSGDINRTSFMYTLDRLGYRGNYDTYDHTGMGNTNNQLGGRATIEQAQGYSLIVYDAGDVGASGTIMPDGSDDDAQKVDQVGWFQNWLAQASVSEVGFATLWVLGSNVLEEKPTSALYTTEMGTSMASTGQTLGVNPDVLGQASFTFDVGTGGQTVDFAVGARAGYSLNGGCPTIRNYDGQQAGAGTNVYLYADPNTGATGDAAVVMNSDPAANWNTIMMSHPWFDMRDVYGGTPASLTSQEDLLKQVVESVVPLDCVILDPVDTGDPIAVGVPSRTALHQNAPNPFNPVTTIRFDLSRQGRVSLRIYDVGGRLVRTLVDRAMVASRHEVSWNGMDERGSHVPSGLYFYRLSTNDFNATRKMIVVR